MGIEATVLLPEGDLIFGDAVKIVDYYITPDKLEPKKLDIRAIVITRQGLTKSIHTDNLRVKYEKL